MGWNKSKVAFFTWLIRNNCTLYFLFNIAKYANRNSSNNSIFVAGFYDHFCSLYSSRKGEAYTMDILSDIIYWGFGDKGI